MKAKELTPIQDSSKGASAKRNTPVNKAQRKTVLGTLSNSDRSHGNFQGQPNSPQIDIPSEENNKSVKLNIDTEGNQRETIISIDDLKNLREYINSKQILREIQKHSEISVEYAYQLARGDLAIHLKSKEDRDILFSDLTPASFGGAKKHYPNSVKSVIVFVKGVDTSCHISELITQLNSQGIFPLNQRRLINRDTGRPTQTIRLECNAVDAAILMNEIELSINNMKCTFERARTTIIRCFNCQKFGHISKNCRNPPQCVRCSANHNTVNCNAPAKCSNCFGPHPAHSSTQVPC